MRTTRKRGGRTRLSDRAKSLKKKQADILMAEKNVLRKKKKLETEKAKLLKMDAKRNELKQKVDTAEKLFQQAANDLVYYQNQLRYSDLQGTQTQ